MKQKMNLKIKQNSIYKLEISLLNLLNLNRIYIMTPVVKNAISIPRGLLLYLFLLLNFRLKIIVPITKVIYPKKNEFINKLII